MKRANRVDNEKDNNNSLRKSKKEESTSTEGSETSSSLSDDETDLSSSSSSSNTETTSEEVEKDIVQVDFDFFDLMESDLPILRKLLYDLLIPVKTQSSKENVIHDITTTLSNAMDKDNIICWPGSTVKTEGKESEPLSILTALAKEFFCELLKDNETFEDFKTFGWIVKLQSFMNCPGELALPLYDILLNELKEYEESKWKMMTNIVIICRTYQYVKSCAGEPAQSSKKKSKLKFHPTNEVFFTAPEDELLGRFASFEKTLPMVSNKDLNPDSKRAFNEEGYIDGRKLFILNMHKLKEYIAEVKTLF